jgi:hypothetical protein
MKEGYVTKKIEGYAPEARILGHEELREIIYGEEALPKEEFLDGTFHYFDIREFNIFSSDNKGVYPVIFEENKIVAIS